MIEVMNKVNGRKSMDATGGPGVDYSRLTGMGSSSPLGTPMPQPIASSTTPFSNMTIGKGGTIIIGAAPKPVVSSTTPKFAGMQTTSPTTMFPSTYPQSTPQTYTPPARPQYMIGGEPQVPYGSFTPTPGGALQFTNAGPTMFGAPSSSRMVGQQPEPAKYDSFVEYILKNPFGYSPSAKVLSPGAGAEEGAAGAQEDVLSTELRTEEQKQEEAKKAAEEAAKDAGGVRPPAGAPGAPVSGPAGTVSDYDAAVDAVKRGVGAKTFAFERLGEDASITRRKEEMDKVLRKTLNIDLLEKQLNRKINTGLNLEGDLVSYIQTKDEVVNSIDSIIDDVMMSAADPDAIADPVRNANNKTYLNYLAIMKGRANQRYVDFANQSIKIYGQQLDALQKQYDTTIGLYEKKYEIGANIIAEEYEQDMTRLVEMYTTIDGAEEKALNLATLRNSVGTSGNSALDTFLKTLGFSDDTKFISADVEDWTKKLWDDKSKVRTRISMGDIINRVTSGEGSMQGALNGLMQAIRYDIQAHASSPQDIERIKRDLDEMMQDESFLSLAQTGPVQSAIVAIDNLKKDLINSSITANVQNIKDAMDDLVPMSGGALGFWQSRKTIREKQEWISKWSSKVPSFVLTKLYDGFVATGQTDLIDQLLVEGISDYEVANELIKIVASAVEGEAQTGA